MSGPHRLKWRKASLGLPLLAKELVEIANRRSTYVLRTLYAVILFGFVLYFYWNHNRGQTGPAYSILGTGNLLFDQIVSVKLWAIYLLTPLLTASSIAAEKERDTLQLIFLTKLGRWAILLEKLLGRLVPMTAYLLLTLPAFAVAYSLGGVEVGQMANAAVAMLMAMLQAGCVALFCSTWCRTTVSAFLMTFPVLGLSYILPAILIRLTFGVEGLVPFCDLLSAVTGLTVTTGGAELNLLTVDDFLFAQVPARLLVVSSHLIYQGAVIPDEMWRIKFQMLPMLLYCGLFLGMARYCLVRRASLPPGNTMLRLFRFIDGVVHRANERYTRGIVLVNDSVSLPESSPLFWRETRKKSLGTFRYLVRVLVVLETPALMIGLIAATGGFRQSRSPALSACIAVFWAIAVLGTAIRAATLFSGERSQATLDVLLSTPMRAADMLKEKVCALHRLMFVLATPLITMYLTHTFTASAVAPFSDWGVYLIGALTTVAIYLPLVCWIGVLCGLRSKNQTRAMFTVLTVLLLAGFAIPMLLVFLSSSAFLYAFPYETAPRIDLLLQMLMNLFLPVAFPAMLESPALGGRIGPQLMLIGLLNSLLYGSLLWMVRRYTLRRASRLLGRPESPHSAPTPWKFLEDDLAKDTHASAL
jgi:ABC-type transport system involved in multi-copper enzyme maturation permease subunit